jgi:(p)ppGpp synthase/HD superfamily hydrolase
MDAARLLEAVRFAARAHHGQVWKGRAEIPYLDHVLDVARRLAQTHPEDEVLIVAGLLHDTIEDCGLSQGDIVARFGEAVAALVQEVTDDPSLPEAERRAAQERHVRHASDRAKRLKLADKTANLSAVARTPPDWPPARMTDYVDWALRVIDPVRGLDPVLEAGFDEAVAEARTVIAARNG